MKKLNLFLVFIMLSITVFGQDIIIDFAGEGASTEVTTVEVLNLSNCTNIEVPEGSSLNLTTGEIVTTIEEFENLENNFISSYPNPFGNSTSIEFYVNQNNYVSITICDIAGKIVANYSKEMTAGIHSFEFTANNLGMYFINVYGNDFVQSSKIICLSNNSQQAKLVYNEQVAENITGKSYKNGNSKDFSFTVGNRLKLKGISGEYAYATVMTVTPTVSATYTFNFVECTGGDNNNYATIEIGEQTWMAENLNTTSYANGDDIDYVQDETDWTNLGNNDEDKAYCYYETDGNSSGEIYGALYTYAAATNGDNSGTNVQGVCPNGWHLPSDAEWTTFTDELGGIESCAGKLKTHCLGLWDSPNTGATNETGFTAIPGGARGATAFFFDIGMFAHWWTSTEYNSENAWERSVDFFDIEANNFDYQKSTGMSVRCIKD